MPKKIIFVFLIVFIFLAGGILGFVCGKGKWTLCSKLEERACGNASPSPSVEPSLLTVSEETKKSLADFGNYTPGVAAGFKEIPLFPGVAEKDVWTFSKPVEGIIYNASTTADQALSFYVDGLGTAGWTLEKEEQANGRIAQTFSKPSLDKTLFLLVGDAPSAGLPKELGLKAQTFISLHFIEK